MTKSNIANSALRFLVSGSVPEAVGSSISSGSTVSEAVGAGVKALGAGLVGGVVPNAVGNEVSSKVPIVSFIPGSGSSAGSGSVAVDAGSGMAATMPDYLYADLAKAYGMPQETAYQEALANTSYQRAVQDLQRAGLNPVLAASSLSGASGVGYISNGGNVSAGRSSAHGAYNILNNVGGIVGAIVGAFGGSAKSTYYGSRIGSQIGGSIGNLLDLK